MAIEKSVLSIVAYGLLSHLRYLYRFYHSRAARTWSFCNEMYHNVLRDEYSDDSLIRTRLFPVDISGFTSFPDY